jgi:hypothetical protein
MRFTFAGHITFLLTVLVQDKFTCNLMLKLPVDWMWSFLNDFLSLVLAVLGSSVNLQSW